MECIYKKLRYLLTLKDMDGKTKTESKVFAEVHTVIVLRTQLNLH